MSFLLNLLKPAPHLPEIEDAQVVKQEYTYWRFRILYSMFIGYAFYYFTRKSFAIAMPGLIADLQFDKAQLGSLSSIFAIAYGFSKFTSGIMSDRSNPRYFMAFGLIITGVINILFGMTSSLFIFALLWGLNGWFQGFGVPPCVRFLTQWYSHSERGSWWSSWSVSHNVGSFLIAWIAGWCLQYLGWRYAMYIPGCIAILGGLFLINRLRDTPQSLGLPPIDKYRNDYVDLVEADFDKPTKMSSKQLLVEHVLKNRYIWLLAIAYFFVYVVRAGINDWTALFLIETKGYGQLLANGTASLADVGGFFGSLFAGWSSDRMFKARRGPINILFTISIFFSIFLFWCIPVGFPWLDSMAIFFVGFSVYGPQMLIGVAAAELAHKDAAATSNGFVGLAAYFGAASAGYPLGQIAENWGWEGYFFILMVAAFVALLALLPMWNVSKVEYVRA